MSIQVGGKRLSVHLIFSIFLQRMDGRILLKKDITVFISTPEDSLLTQSSYKKTKIGEWKTFQVKHQKNENKNIRNYE